MLYKIYIYTQMLITSVPDIFLHKKVSFLDCLKLIRERGEHMDASLRMYDGYRRAIHFGRYIFVKDYTDLKNKNILDMACGMGYGSEYLAKHSKSVTGVDISELSISYSQKYHSQDNITYHQGDASKIIFNKQFDIITSFETIEHLPDEIIHQYLETLYSSLDTSGLLFISSPNKWGKTIYHFQDFNYESFQKILEKNNFKIIDSFKQNSGDLENKFNHGERSGIHKIKNISDSKTAEILIFVCRKNA